MAPAFNEFEGEQVTRDELLEVVENEKHISCLLENAAANALKFFEGGQHFRVLEDGAESIKPSVIEDISNSLDSYAGLVLAIADRVREVGGLPIKNTGLTNL